jgi:hypothetical protein
MSRLPVSRRCLLFGAVLAALAFSASAAATRISTSQIPLSAALVSPCTADVVTFTGTAVLTVTQHTAPNGTVKLSVAAMVKDPQAVGVLYPYNFKDQLISSDVVNFDNVYKIKVTDRLHFIRLGPDGDQQSDDLFVTVVIYAAVNRDLILTADRIDYFVDCK